MVRKACHAWSEAEFGATAYTSAAIREAPHLLAQARQNVATRSAAQEHALWLDVNALIHACVFLFPTSLVHEKPPQFLMRLHPKHRIDLVFLEHGIPGGLINLPLYQLDIVTQQIIRISGSCPTVDEHGYGALSAEDQNSTDVPVVEEPGMREMLF